MTMASTAVRRPTAAAVIVEPVQGEQRGDHRDDADGDREELEQRRTRREPRVDLGGDTQTGDALVEFGEDPDHLRADVALDRVGFATCRHHRACMVTVDGYFAGAGRGRLAQHLVAQDDLDRLLVVGPHNEAAARDVGCSGRERRDQDARRVRAGNRRLEP